MFQLPPKGVITDRHRSHTPDVLQQSPNILRLKHRSALYPHSPSSQNLSVHLSPPSPIFQPTGSMSIDESTRIGPILYTHLPTMVNDYFRYCSRRSQANRSFQAKCDSNEQFRAQLQTFQEQTGGLSLTGFLTKPIQRVTRYPLLIEKILKHTSDTHADYTSIAQALECARQLNEGINKQISEHESSSRLEWLQHHLSFGSDENCSDGCLFDEQLKFQSVTRFGVQRQLLLHGVVAKVRRNHC